MMCSRSFRKVLFVCALAALAVWSAAPAGAEIIPVNLHLDPPAAPVNTLDVDIAVTVTGGGSIADGETTTAVNRVTPIDDATFAFQSTQRTLDGQLLPNIDEVLVVRK